MAGLIIVLVQMMRTTHAILLFLIPCITLGQTIISEKPLIKQGIGYKVPNKSEIKHEGLPFEMEVFKDKNGVWRFRNNTNKTVSIVLDFTTESLPFIGVCTPGLHNLFRYMRIGRSSRSFSYSFYYTQGIVNSEHSNYKYLLPVPNGKEVTASAIKFDPENPFKSPIKYHDGISKFYGMEFEPRDTYTVTAIRGGIVEYLEDRLPGNDMKNRVRIIHADGTSADYLGFAELGINVKLGDKVLAGQLLGNLDINRKLFVSLSYQSLKVDREIPYTEWLKTVFLQPNFKTEEYNKSLKTGETYVSVHNASLITQEMGKRQKKKYLSGRN